MNIKKTLFKLLLIAGLALSFSSVASAQLLTQTTLSTPVTGGSNFETGITPLQSFVTLASITGLQPALFGTQIQSYIYVDRELMGVVGPIPSSATLPVPVIRGMRGTAVAQHVSGAMVLFGQVNLLGQNVFFDRDPNAGTCSVSFPQVPWINILTGNQWLCANNTGGAGDWVPGFNNPGSSQQGPASCGTFASVAGTNAVPCPIFAVSGTNAVVTWTPPLGFNLSGYGCFTTIPTGIYTWTAAGNISVAGTVTAITQNVTFCWNPVTQKWIPSRVA